MATASPLVYADWIIPRLPSADMDVTVREYAPNDYQACRRLWVELTEHHRKIYGDRTIGGDDPGSGFDDYPEIPARVSSWVAVIDGDVVRLTGLFYHRMSGEVETLAVTDAHRQQAVGPSLVERVGT